MKNNLSGGQAKSALNNGVAGVTTGELNHSSDGPGKAPNVTKDGGLVRHTVAANRVAGWAVPMTEGPQRGIAKSAAQSFWKGFCQGTGLVGIIGGAALSALAIVLALGVFTVALPLWIPGWLVWMNEREAPSVLEPNENQ